jgi:hypothetical protein
LNAVCLHLEASGRAGQQDKGSRQNHNQLKRFNHQMNPVESNTILAIGHFSFVNVIRLSRLYAWGRHPSG